MKYTKKDIKIGFEFYNTMGNKTTVLGRVYSGSNFMSMKSSTGRMYEVHIEQLISNLNNGTYKTISIGKEQWYEIY